MSQLTQLIEQARNRRGINDLFKTKVDSLAFSPENGSGKSRVTLNGRLDELEQLLFDRHKNDTQSTSEMISCLEAVLDDL